MFDAFRGGRQHQGMRAFVFVWLGQLVSLLGSAMSIFALTIWTYQETGEATALALITFFSFGPSVLLSPIAGALVDRWNRKLVMILSDLAAGLATIAILLLFSLDQLQVWHLYVSGAFVGVFQAFQFPAYSAAITLMLPKEQYARASGMLSLAQSGSGVLAPAAAGGLIAAIGVRGVLLIDVITFTVAIVALLLVYVPQPETASLDDEGKGALWVEALYGFRYIWSRPSLLGLQLVFFGINFVGAFGIVLTPPLILARTANNEIILGSVLSITALGGVAGGLLLSAWGGPARKVHGILLGMLGISLFGRLGLGVGRSLPVWAVAGFVSMFFIPLVNGSNQAIWQAKVAPSVQGRVFAVRRLIAQVTFPLATLLAGPLADQVFEPALQPDGMLAQPLGWLVGTGPGAGIGFIFVLSGICGTLIALSGYLFPLIRQAEERLPDHSFARQT